MMSNNIVKEFPKNGKNDPKNVGHTDRKKGQSRSNSSDENIDDKLKVVSSDSPDQIKKTTHSETPRETNREMADPADQKLPTNNHGPEKPRAYFFSKNPPVRTPLFSKAVAQNQFYTEGTLEYEFIELKKRKKQIQRVLNKQAKIIFDDKNQKMNHLLDDEINKETYIIYSSKKGESLERICRENDLKISRQEILTEFWKEVAEPALKNYDEQIKRLSISQRNSFLKKEIGFHLNEATKKYFQIKNPESSIKSILQKNEKRHLDFESIIISSVSKENQNWVREYEKEFRDIVKRIFSKERSQYQVLYMKQVGKNPLFHNAFEDLLDAAENYIVTAGKTQTFKDPYNIFEPTEIPEKGKKPISPLEKEIKRCFESQIIPVKLLYQLTEDLKNQSSNITNIRQYENELKTHARNYGLENILRDRNDIIPLTKTKIEFSTINSIISDINSRNYKKIFEINKNPFERENRDVKNKKAIIAIYDKFFLEDKSKLMDVINSDHFHLSRNEGLDFLANILTSYELAFQSISRLDYNIKEYDPNINSLNYQLKLMMDDNPRKTYENSQRFLESLANQVNLNSKQALTPEYIDDIKKDIYAYLEKKHEIKEEKSLPENKDLIDEDPEEQLFRYTEEELGKFEEKLKKENKLLPKQTYDHIKKLYLETRFLTKDIKDEIQVNESINSAAINHVLARIFREYDENDIRWILDQKENYRQIRDYSLNSSFEEEVSKCIENISKLELLMKNLKTLGKNESSELKQDNAPFSLFSNHQQPYEDTSLFENAEDYLQKKEESKQEFEKLRKDYDRRAEERKKEMEDFRNRLFGKSRTQDYSITDTHTGATKKSEEMKPSNYAHVQDSNKKRITGWEHLAENETRPREEAYAEPVYMNGLRINAVDNRPRPSKSRSENARAEKEREEILEEARKNPGAYPVFSQAKMAYLRNSEDSSHKMEYANLRQNKKRNNISGLGNYDQNLGFTPQDATSRYSTTYSRRTSSKNTTNLAYSPIFTKAA